MESTLRFSGNALCSQACHVRDDPVTGVLLRVDITATGNVSLGRGPSLSLSLSSHEVLRPPRVCIRHPRSTAQIATVGVAIRAPLLRLPLSVWFACPFCWWSGVPVSTGVG